MVVDSFRYEICSTDSKHSLIIMNIILLGSTNPSGSAFLDIPTSITIHVLGRKCPRNLSGDYTFLDLTESSELQVNQLDGVLVSFAPIWMLASFIKKYHERYPHHLSKLRGIIACSSSSFITKRFSFNEYDKNLSKKLTNAHHSLATVCQKLDIPHQILAPTLVYGCVNEYTDKNLNKIMRVMKLMPYVYLPNTTGLRQPIHARQLALIAFQQATKMCYSEWFAKEPEVLPLGGDTIISYKDMILKYVAKLDKMHKAKKCKVVSIPDRLYLLIILPFLLINPKLFEALLRIKSDMAYFAKSHEILGQKPQDFPLSISSPDSQN
jgi:hypothetical protein